MLRNHFAKLLAFALLSATGAGCTKHADGIPGATGPAGQAGTNGIAVKPSPVTGYIDLVDPYNRPLPPAPGVTLSVKTGDSLVTAITDSTGKFSLGPLPPGTYSIDVKKNGFDSLKIFVQHSGGDEAKFIGGTTMFQSLTTKISSQTYYFQTDTYGDITLYLTTTLGSPIPAGAFEKDFQFDFSHTADFTSQSTDYGYISGQTSTGNQFTLQFLLINLTQNATNKFHSGDTVYVKTTEIHPFESRSWYYDYSTDRYISYPYPGDSAVTWFKMP